MEDLQAIMTACIILHNMIIEDEREEVDNFEEANNHRELEGGMSRAMTATLDTFLQRHQQIQSAQRHFQLWHNLIESLWQQEGNED